jgi:hypothetical protein
MLQNLYFNTIPSDAHHPHSPTLSHHTPTRPNTPLTVQTHNLARASQQHGNLNITIPSNYLMNDMQTSNISPNSLSAYHNTNTLPPSPSPSSLMSDDDASSLYSPHSPHTPSNPTAESSGTSPDYRQSSDSGSLHPMHHPSQFSFSLSHNMWRNSFQNVIATTPVQHCLYHVSYCITTLPSCTSPTDSQKPSQQYQKNNSFFFLQFYTIAQLLFIQLAMPCVVIFERHKM